MKREVFFATSIIMALGICLQSYAFNVNTVKNAVGDLNGDGLSDTVDLSLIGLSLIGDIELSENQKKQADVDNDKSVTLADLARYQQFIAKKIPHLVQSEYNIKGKNVHVYHFGGQGNDWCFVRTPENYDPNRTEPYPFVICNHGNGWNMNGSKQFANWTKRTMYVPLYDPDYIADPAQYNGTNDESLWYSNPTIEALLNAGYVVCGCENYGDNLFGNDNCRNACVDFFNHMVSEYNVEDRCHMIGASNGAQTCISAAYLLGDKVKSMILQYPLTCLVEQYKAYPNHRAVIRKAYGITDENITEADLISATMTYDSLNTNVVDGKKVGYFPPVKMYYSTTDSVVPCEVNTLKLYKLLVESQKDVEIVQVDSDGEKREHGDYAHFNPDDYVEWFEKW